MIPTKLHKRCIFRETCSHYVYRIASQQGFFEGLRALKVRNELCRPGYVVYRSQGRYYLQTANGSVFAEDEIALSELPPHNLFGVAEEEEPLAVMFVDEPVILPHIVVHPMVMLFQFVEIHLRVLLAGIHPEAWAVQLPSFVQFDERGQNMGLFSIFSMESAISSFWSSFANSAYCLSVFAKIQLFLQLYWLVR